MLWLDQKFAASLASRVRNYHRVDSYVFNFSCPDKYPFCGDSKRNPRKARGYLFRKGSGLLYHCHRCGLTRGFPHFLKEFDDELYGEYLQEKNLGSGTPPPKKYEYDSYRISEPEFIPVVRSLPGSLSGYPREHPAWQYLLNRKIPIERVSEMSWTDDFFGLAAELFPGKYADKTRGLEMVVIPVNDRSGSVVGIQGRDISGKIKSKYITCAPDGVSLCYGIDRVEEGLVYAFEGPFDSMFVDNGVSTLGGTMISDLLATNVDPDRFVVVYDNEPRSPQTVKKIYKAIEAGFKVCVWARGVQQKDVNDMILAGYRPDQVKLVIDSCTYQGAEAIGQLHSWKRCKITL